METKVCTKCNIEKTFSEFTKKSKHKETLRSTCKKCDYQTKKVWKKNNPEKVREERKKWKKKNPEKVKEYKKKWRLNNPEKYSEKQRRGYERRKERRKLIPKVVRVKIPKVYVSKVKPDGSEKKNIQLFCRKCEIELTSDNKYVNSGRICKECEKNRMKEYRTKYPDKRKQTKKQWEKNNSQHHKKLKRDYIKRKKASDPVYRAIMTMRRRTSQYGKKKFNEKRGNFREIIGIDQDGFRDYIASKFKEGMSWDNYGLYTWHIDHIIPISLSKTIKDVEKLSHYTNLQPLWANENIDKGVKII